MLSGNKIAGLKQTAEKASHEGIMGDMQISAAHDVAFDLVHVAALGSGVQTHIRLTDMSTLRDI